jgi:hypothetical protein
VSFDWRPLEKLKAWLADVNTTSLRIASDIPLWYGTAVVIWYCMIEEKQPSVELAVGWLSALLAHSGVTAWQYVQKRKTYSTDITEQRATVATAAVPAPGASP